MKLQLFKLNFWLPIIALILFMLTGSIANAQENVNLDKEQVVSWIERYWMWIVGGIVLLLIIALSGRRSRRLTGGKRKTTTVVRDADGKTRSVTTTEEPI